jgi:hypothetical protein
VTLRVERVTRGVVGLARSDLLVGIGFACTVGSITAVAVNTVQPAYVGMASATTNMLRDLGFVLGLVLGGAIAFSAAGSRFTASLATSHLPAAVVGAAQHIPPMGAINIPNFPAAGLATDALGHGFSVAFVVGAVAAAAMATLAGLHRTTRQASGADVLAPEPEAA